MTKELIAKLVSGELEMVYASPETHFGYVYCTLRPKNPIVVLATEEQIKETAHLIVETNKDKARQWYERPQLIGWFVGQTLKAFHGNADPRLVENVCNNVLRNFIGTTQC
jgi:hypothetical protein